MWSTQWYSKPYPIFQEREREWYETLQNSRFTTGSTTSWLMLKICLNHSNNFIAGYKVWIYPHRISMFVASNGYCPMVNLSFNSFNGLHLFRRCPMRHLEGAAKATDGSSHCFAGARSGRRQADGSLLRQEGKTILFAGIFYDLGGEKCLILPCFTRKPKIGGAHSGI